MTDEGLFVWAGARGRRVKCSVCGAIGYPGGSWQEGHRTGHPFECSICQRVFINVQGIAAHRRHHEMSADQKRADGFSKPKGVLAYWARK